MSNISDNSGDSPNESSDNNPASHHFAQLTPDTILDAVESLGVVTTGALLALNSYENRVVQVGIDEQAPLIAKFYRPNRWSDEAILEDHAFSLELAAQELPVVPPMTMNDATLHHWQGLRFAVFERRGGRAPELDNLDHLHTLGTTLGQMHQVGRAQTFQHRPTLTIKTFGYRAQQVVLTHTIPKDLSTAYETITNDLLALLEQHLSQHSTVALIRTHGDCHPGNILWRDDKPNFVDLDDARMAPAVQDLWMLLSGDKPQQQAQMREIIEGYECFCEFNRQEMYWIEPLRTLRLMNHCAWLSERWTDPAFPHHFPWFNTDRYWGEHILELKEQLFALQNPMYDAKFLDLF